MLSVSLAFPAKASMDSADAPQALRRGGGAGIRKKKLADSGDGIRIDRWA
jgi:hypothetical protein